MYLRLSVRAYGYVYVFMCVRLWVCAYVLVCLVRAYGFVYVCLCTCVYVLVCVCVSGCEWVWCKVHVSAPQRLGSSHTIEQAHQSYLNYSSNLHPLPFSLPLIFFLFMPPPLSAFISPSSLPDTISSCLPPAQFLPLLFPPLFSLFIPPTSPLPLHIHFLMHTRFLFSPSFSSLPHPLLLCSQVRRELWSWYPLSQRPTRPSRSS